MASRYAFSEYSVHWSAAFEREAACLCQLLGAEEVEVHQIGSTSVPGLAAKPIIDLLPFGHGLEVVDGINERFEEAGDKVWGEYWIPGRRFFTKDQAGGEACGGVVAGEGGGIVRSDRESRPVPGLSKAA
jgi:GrpB-like predicted nucleotidyltransferase (UPF0157 family)